MNSDSWCFQKRISTIIFICCIFCVSELTGAVKQINLLAVSSKRWDILLVFDVFSPPPPSLSLPLHFNFHVDFRTVCLPQYEWFLVLSFFHTFFPYMLILLVLQAKKNWSGILFSLLTYSLSRDVHMHRKNDQRHIYSSNLKFFSMRFSQPGHLRGCCHISPNVSLPLPPGIS